MDLRDPVGKPALLALPFRNFEGANKGTTVAEDGPLPLVQSPQKLPLDAVFLCYPINNFGKPLVAGLKIGL